MIRMMVVGGLVTVDNTPQHDILDCYKMEQNSERVNTPYFHSLRERTKKNDPQFIYTHENQI